MLQFSRLSFLSRLRPKSYIFFICLAVGFLFLLHPAFPESMSEVQSENYGKLPLSFESNLGQIDSTAKFLARGFGYSIFFLDHEADIVFLRKSADRSISQHSPADFITDKIRMQLIGSGETAHLSGEERLPGTANYFHGASTAEWRTAIPTYAKVKYSAVYPGVDLVYYGNQQRLEFDFQVAAGADTKQIQLRFAGARKLKLDSEGNLTIFAPNGKVSFRKPVIYQTAPGEQKKSIQGEFVVISSDTVGFHIGTYDHAKPLVIDPILSYSTYLGRAGRGTAIAVDSVGAAYITGWAEVDFPTTAGTPEQISAPKPENVYSAFVTKLNSSGTALVYSTYLSGTGSDQGTTIAVDGQGNAYLAGMTSSGDFPTTPGAFQTVNKAVPYNTAFVAKLNSTGTALLYSTYLGGSHLKNSNQFTSPGAEEKPVGISVNSTGEAYVAGLSGSTDFPTTPGAFQSTNNATATSTFLARLNTSGSGLIYSTYLGGSNDEEPTAAALDNSGNFYVTGSTASTDFPVTAKAFQTSSGTGWSGFLAKMNPTGTALVYSTYFGANRTVVVNAIALNSVDEAYIAGNTIASNLPTTPGAFQSSIKPGSQNIFVAKFNSSGSALIYCTYFGGSTDDVGGVGEDEANGIALDPSGNVTVVGDTASTDFPLTPGALYTQNTAWLESLDHGSFLTKLNNTGTALLYSTYFSGSGDLSGETCECVDAIAADLSGNIYLTGVTVSTDFPVTSGAFQTSPYGPGSDAFVTKFNAAEMTHLATTTTTVTANPGSQIAGSPIVFTVTVYGSGSSIPSGTVGVSVNGNPWSTFALDQTGSLAYSTSLLPAGTDTVVTYYLGDANNAPSTNYLNVTISPGSGQLPTAIVVTPSLNPVPYGAPVTLNVSVQDPSGKGAPIGTVSLVFIANWQSPYANQTISQTQLDAQGHASFTTKSLPAGKQNLILNFQTSNANYANSSLSFTEDVTPLGAAASPVLSLPSGTYPGPQKLTITDGTPGAGIYYSIDGETSQYIYYNPINISASETISVYASGAGYSNSPVVSATYTIGSPAQAPTPSISPASGNYSSAQHVTITDSVFGANIYYTTNGSTPTTSSALYTGPFTVSSAATVEAVAVASGYSTSSIAAATYTINLPPSDFSVSLASSSLAISHGQSATTSVTMTPTNGFNQSVSLSCSGLPAGVSCSFSPQAVTAESPTATLMLSANSVASSYQRDPHRFAPLASLALLICWIGMPKRLRKGLAGWIVWTSTGFILLAGCGGGKSASSSPITINATVTATSSSLSHTVPLTVTLN